MKKTLSIAMFSLLTLAAAQKTQTVYINGQPVQAISTTVNGKPGLSFITSDLQKTGALTQGGSKPVEAIQGCKGQTLFNGVLRVTLLEAGLKDDHYQVLFKISNGTNKEISIINDSGFNYEYIWAADDKGNVVKFNYWDENNSPNSSILPGSTRTVIFLTNTSENPTFTPTRVLWRIDDKSINKNLPWAKVRNMEFKLECK